MVNWFAPKRYGIGTGWPITWQGWALIAVYLLIIGAALLIFDDDPLVWAIVLPATGAFVSITAGTTRGGWRWRWGDKE
ncbi:MAG TPA: hypothetical protein VGR05_02970 [Sphingomicrobium sp.]|nr:hypothetical protein [Sphingomicrobium sp.]